MSLFFPRFLPARNLALCALLFVISSCATAPAPVELTAPRIEGVRLGVLVATLDGETVFEERADERFIPASNTKIFTAAAAFQFVPGVSEPDPALGTRLELVPGDDGAAPALALIGNGDATVRDGADCVANCLADLADAVVLAGIKEVSAVYGDDTAFPFEPWGLGWSWNNLPFYFGAPVSALTVNGNAAALRVGPSTEGQPVEAVWAESDDLLSLRNDALTGPPGGESLLSVLRWPGSDVVHLTGTLPADTPARNFFLSVPDPALTASARLVRLLEARGVTVRDGAKVRGRDDPPATGTQLIASLPAPPLLQSIADVLEDSDNLSAELLLRHVARATGGAGSEDGLEAVSAMLEQAGVGPAGVELFDGSGLSPYNRVTPRAAVQFLTWTASQPWSEAFKSALPVGGQTGSLSRRFRGTLLDGRIFAKTGTVQGVNALSGFMMAASGETLVFSVIANDRPVDADSVIPKIDALLLGIAAEN